MEGETVSNPAGTISALFALTAFIVALCSRRFATALKWSAVIAAGCVLLFVALTLGYAPEILLSGYGMGRLLGYAVVVVLLGLLGHGIRKLFSLFFGLFRRTPREAPPQ
jgi:hypothetical protein